MPKSLFPAGLALAAAIALAGPAAAAEPRTHTVVIDQMRFGPMPADARAGDTILWVNRDVVPHTATAPGRFDVVLAAGKSGRTLLRTPGRLNIVCRYHPAMRALLVARP